MNDRFGVGIGVEGMSALQEVLPQFLVVEDFPVENDLNGSILVVDRLVSSIQVDDAETPHPKSDARFEIESFVIGTTVNDRVAHPLQLVRIHRFSVQAHNSGNAAHDI
jgi:hypothetical protein